MPIPNQAADAARAGHMLIYVGVESWDGPKNPKMFLDVSGTISAPAVSQLLDQRFESRAETTWTS